MSANVHLVEQTDRRLRFRNRPLSGLVIAVFGLGFGWLAIATGAEVPWVPWLFGGFGLLFAVAGLAGFLWRDELLLDLESGRLHRAKGFWPSRTEEEGSLDRLRGVVLTRRWVRSSSKKSQSEHVEWTVGLEVEGWDQPLGIYATRNEDRAYRELERFAKMLGRDALDRSGPEEVRTPWTELDVTLSERLIADGVVIPEGARLPSPPAGSGIELLDEGRTIVLPAPGMSLGAGLLVLFGLFFGGIGAVPMLAALGIGVQMEVEGPVFIVGPIFILVGLGLALLTLAATGAREVVRDEGDTLVFTTRLLGRDRFLKPLPKSRVEEVAVRRTADARSRTADARSRTADARSRTADARSRTTVRVGKTGAADRAADGAAEVLVRTDEKIVRIGDEVEDAEGREWLRAALTAMAARGAAV